MRFTHVATPEENSYIKAFHSILEHDVIERNEFASYYEAKEIFGRYFFHYNRTDFYGSNKGWRITFFIFFTPTNNGTDAVNQRLRPSDCCAPH